MPSEKKKKELVEKFIKLDKLQKYEVINGYSHGDLVYEFQDSFQDMDEDDIQAIEEEIDGHLEDK